MKSKVLSRPMFQKAMDPENVGIMHGFKDSLEDNLKKVMSMSEEDDDENEAPEYENEDEEGESGKMIGRTPRSPEILMNTLRGDMRSPSARRKELADLVGEEAAMETPEEVLTLLQSKLGQGIASVPGSQNAGPAPGGAPPPPLPPSGAGAPPSGPTGLEALGPQLQAAGLTPPAGGAPAPEAPAPAPGAGPTAPGPLNMADGGEVSYERYYAGGGAVEKKNESVTGLEGFFKPDKEAIKKGMTDYSSLYADILGDPKEQQSLDKALMLAQIAQRGFNFAANVSPTGAPLSGSFASRAAGAFGDVPGILLEGTKNQREREQKLKLAAFDAARQDESESRKLMAQYAIAGRRASKPGKIFTVTGPGGATRQVQQASDGTGYLDMAGNETAIGPGEILSELGRGGQKSTAKAVALWDTNENAVYGRGVVKDGVVTTVDGNPVPDYVVPVNFSPPQVGLSAAAQRKAFEESAEQEAAVVELAQATRTLKDQIQGETLGSDPEASRAALTSVVSRLATGLDNIKYEIAAVPTLLGMSNQADPGDVLEKANELASIESYNWGSLSSESAKLKQGILFVALKSAKAQGLGTGSNLSNKDVQRSVDMLSGSTSNPNVFTNLLDNNLNLITENYLSRKSGRLVSPDERNSFYENIGLAPTRPPMAQNPPPVGTGGFSYDDGDISIEELP